MVKDLTPGLASTTVILFPGASAAIGSQVIFIADVGNHGYELWRSRGTAPTTRLLKEIGPGSSSGDVQSVVAVGNRVFFSADDGTHGNELWVTDGTGPATYMVKDLYP